MPNNRVDAGNGKQIFNGNFIENPINLINDLREVTNQVKNAFPRKKRLGLLN